MTPFDFVNSINFTKKDLIAENKDNEKFYAPFVVNKTLSYFADCVFIANEINMFHHLPNKQQYSFLLNMIGKRKRFAKWHKFDNEVIEAIQHYYNVSYNKAVAMLPLLTDEQKNMIKDNNGRGHLQ